ncbi:MAG: tal [Acidimicrobiales bacterium]|nr:tal [Acidimicrobiales bacterium]
MTKLHDLYRQFGQSPWLDNLRRDWLVSGEVQHWVDRGVRGITSNPSIFAKAMAAGDAYDEQFASLIAAGRSVDDAYWEMVITDITDALAILRPVHDESGGEDGYVSVEVDPALARDTAGTIVAARDLHTRLDAPNLYVKIPGTAEGLPAIQQMIGEGRSINVTLLFSLSRYDEVIEAYLAGLERCEGSLDHVSSVASFFVSRVDAAVDKLLDQIGTDEARALRGKAAVANAKLAYELFLRRFSGERWERLLARGARVQRPLWASTSTKDPSYPKTLYVDSLIAPDTVNTMPEDTLEAFEQSGTLARTADADLDQAHAVIDGLARVGIDLDAVTRQLEDEGVAAFAKSFEELHTSLTDKAHALSTRS